MHQILKKLADEQRTEGQIMKMEIRLANQTEAEVCYQCIEDARAYHKSMGFEQWHPDYPTQQTILDDIAQNIGYAFTQGNKVMQHILNREEFAYCGLIQFDGGPKLAYEWDKDEKKDEKEREE